MWNVIIVASQVSGGEDEVFNQWLWDTWIATWTEIKLGPLITDAKWITAETIRVLEKNRMASFTTYGREKLCNYDSTSKSNESETNKFA